jgi:hypothetical protein
MKNGWRNGGVSFDCPIWMIAGNQTSLVGRNTYNKKRPPAQRRLRLANRTDSDLASAIAYLVLAGSLLASLLEFFASLP